MKRFTLTVGAALLAAAMASPSFAADLARPPFYKAPIAPYIAPFSWSGFYIGLNGGYGWGTSDWTLQGFGLSTGDFDVNGGVAGATLGYNLQTGNWVWGIEADVDASWIKGTDTASCGTPGCETRNDWLVTGRARIGYSWNRFMPFLTGGVAAGDIKMTTPVSSSDTQTQVGWTAGGGVEWAFTGAWSAKIDYLYADLGTASCDAQFCGVPTDVSLKLNLVRAGINYRF
jgi:outer membrane immunogenic protein